jgi:hypothetical protein
MMVSEGSSPVLRMMKWFSKTFGLLLLMPVAAVFCASGAFAQSCITATCTAAGVSEAQFLTALPSPLNLNPTVVVNIPAGTAGWTTGFNYTIPATVTNLTIQGATTVNCTGTAGTSSYNCTAADNAVIQDNINGTYQIQITTGAPSTHLRITGLTLQGGTANSPKYGSIAIYGNSHNVRLDHNHFNISGYASNIVGGWVRFYGPELGVLDHNVLDMGPSQSTDWNGFQAVTTSAAFGDAIGNGDGTFQNATPWGTGNFIYMENNQFNGGYGNDCDAAGLFVMRYNTFNGMTVAEQTHGTKSDGGSIRGCRAFEFYKNYIKAGTTEMDAMTSTKATTSLIWGNTMTSGTAYYFWGGGTDRASTAQGEVATPGGWGAVGPALAGNFTVNVSAPSGGTYTITGSGFSTSWPTASNFLVAYSAGGGNGYANFVISAVGSSSTMTATCAQLPRGATCPAAAQSGVVMAMGSGWDGNFQSNGYPALDGAGRGQTTQALNGQNMPGRLSSVTGTIAWPHQYLEPIYLWMNTINGATELSVRDYISTRNVDIFADNAGFNGTTGTGFGALASRPSTCTAGPGGTYYTSPTGSYGVAYWATDANNGNGELYVCASTNTWTGIYQPYTYPHPLTGGTVVTTVNPPTNLVATVQ